jgi:hypothetical protein
MSVHTHLEPSPTALRAATGAVILTVALALAPNGMSAMAQTSECMEVGPSNSPSWALRADASKREICVLHEAADREAARPVSTSTMGPLGGGTIPLAGKLSLTGDGRTLVLVDEVRAPTSQRQPEIRLSTNENTGAPEVQVAGAGIVALPTITIACGWSRRSISLSNFSQGPLRNVASYDVPESIASMVRHEADCRIALPHSIVPLPRDMVSIVWPTAP